MQKTASAPRYATVLCATGKRGLFSHRQYAAGEPIRPEDAATLGGPKLQQMIDYNYLRYEQREVG